MARGTSVQAEGELNLFAIFLLEIEMKVFMTQEENIDCCHDTLNSKLVNEFLEGGYELIGVGDRVFTIEKVKSKNETIIFLSEEMVMG